MKVKYVDIKLQYDELRDEILSSVDSVFKSGTFILGEQVKKFEDDFAHMCGVTYALGVADGTAALSLSLRALGIGNGDEVITAPNSFFSTASSIVHTGAMPVFADVRDDLNIDPAEIVKKITKKTKAIIPVHLTGRIAEMNEILKIAKDHSLHVIEDSAQAVNAEYQGKISGSMGITGCFSLHPLKNLNAAGDAGIITTNDSEIYEKLKLLRAHGMKDRNTATMWGYNSRLDEIQAAILNVKMKRISDITNRRRLNAEIYKKELSSISQVVKMPTEDQNRRDVYHLFVIQSDRRDELKEFLKMNEIDSGIHYPIPIHLLHVCREMGHQEGDFPVTERIANRMLSLPIHQDLTEDQIKFVSQKIKEFFKL